jgi:hypothetical protein
MSRFAIPALFAAVLHVGNLAYGQVKDVTDDFKDHLNKHLIGIKFDQPLMTVQDNTKNVFGVKTGNQIKARGWAKFDSVTIDGSLKRKE